MVEDKDSKVIRTIVKQERRDNRQFLYILQFGIQMRLYSLELYCYVEATGESTRHGKRPETA